jgi:hypothetical protein
MNARLEFLNHVNNRPVLCAQIQYSFLCRPKVDNCANLTTGWGREDWDKFLSDLDFEYDNGWGSQNLFGTIWYVDGTWSTRHEYDGSEWYEYHVCPPIPKDLNRLDKVREQKLNQIM